MLSTHSDFMSTKRFQQWTFSSEKIPALKMLKPLYVILNRDCFNQIQFAPLGTGYSQGPPLRVLEKRCLKMEQGSWNVITRVTGIGTRCLWNIWGRWIVQKGMWTLCKDLWAHVWKKWTQKKTWIHKRSTWYLLGKTIFICWFSFN